MTASLQPTYRPLAAGLTLLLAGATALAQGAAPAAPRVAPLQVETADRAVAVWVLDRAGAFLTLPEVEADQGWRITLAPAGCAVERIPAPAVWLDATARPPALLAMLGRETPRAELLAQRLAGLVLARFGASRRDAARGTALLIARLRETATAHLRLERTPGAGVRGELRLRPRPKTAFAQLLSLLVPSSTGAPALPDTDAALWRLALDLDLAALGTARDELVAGIALLAADADVAEWKRAEFAERYGALLSGQCTLGWTPDRCVLALPPMDEVALETAADERAFRRWLTELRRGVDVAEARPGAGSVHLPAGAVLALHMKPVQIAATIPGAAAEPTALPSAVDVIVAAHPTELVCEVKIR
ncbi:MAG: hypothetical protein AAF628_05775 [Planctomycetota bacterium]